MSKASEWVKHIKTFDAKAGRYVLVVTTSGHAHIRRNEDMFGHHLTPEEAVQVGKWLLDTFGEEETK